MKQSVRSIKEYVRMNRTPINRVLKRDFSGPNQCTDITTQSIDRNIQSSCLVK